MVMPSALFAGALFVSSTACTSNDPRERAADAIEDTADARADNIESAADQRADMLANRAAKLAKESEAAGGYRGQTLDARGDALRRESGIVRRQGDAQADAVEAEGDARAKELRSQ